MPTTELTLDTVTTFIRQAQVAILAYYQRDADRVKDFYTSAAHLYGRSPVVDAILDGIDRWLIEQAWPLLDVPTVADAASWESEL